MTAQIPRRTALALALAAAIAGAPASAQDPPVERVFDLAIAGGKLAGGARAVRVKQGESVRLRWTADAAAVLHLHGYNVETRVGPGAAAEMAFIARLTGRFSVYSHAPGTPAGGHHHGPALVTVEVYPR